MTNALSPQEVAERIAEVMFANDTASQALGMEIQAVAPGYAKLSMTVREDMLNGHKTCHGGMLFALADSAFAFGCNAYNKITVAQGCEITYLAPGRFGDILTAECQEQALAGRSGVYDVKITNQAGVSIALFRGKSRRISGDVIPGLTPEDPPRP
ncbi:hydroxyphenylacetyl-CoA thioesterase PaaI [Hwanghaeella sp. LZ110]|jgi:acyl-CoA thioesterase|uniref:hydroxyphenylacetyl-CoA thioesterase PaaI n=1 Tax=Hwanghaeella sp. LZ110 TaxID=3402810 RepID=UPI003B678856